MLIDCGGIAAGGGGVHFHVGDTGHDGPHSLGGPIAGREAMIEKQPPLQSPLKKGVVFRGFPHMGTLISTE